LCNHLTDCQAFSFAQCRFLPAHNGQNYAIAPSDPAGYAAQFSFHVRRCCLYTPAPPCSSKSLQQIRQPDLVFVAKEGSSGGDLYERVDASDIRAARHNRLQLALGVTEEHAILTPSFVIFDQLEFTAEQGMEGMRYPKMFAHTALMRCS
jgi:hypothetical protein